MNTINKTGLSFASGVKLTAAQLTTMNDTINALVDVVNRLLLACFDVNLETGNFEKNYTLSQAIDVVSANRRQKGMKIRFLTDTGNYVEYSYVGSTLNDADFRSTRNWITGVDIVDGGEF